MAQGFTFAEAFQPPAPSDEPGGFSFADALGQQPTPEVEPAAPGTFVSPGGAAFVPPKGIKRKAQEPAPAVEPVAPKAEPKPYRSRQEALDDAVNLLEEGYDQAKVVEAFKGLGLTFDEITRHGKKRNSEYFRQQKIEPSQAPAGPAQPTGEIRAFEPTALETVANTFKRANASFGDMATGFLFSTGAFDPDQAAGLIRRNARARAAAAPSEDVQRGMMEIGSSETFGDAATAMLKNPKATFNMLVDSLLITAPTLAATLALAPAGAAVRAGTTFAGSGGMEYTSVMTDVLQDKGIDLTDAAKVAKALSDPKIIQEMKDKGAKRGLIVGAFDALSMGLAGRFMRPANELIAAGKLSGSAAKKATVAAWSKELGVQAGAGAGGEFLAQQATGEFKPAEVLLEGLAEGISAPIDVYGSLREARDLETAARQAEAARTGEPTVPSKIAPERVEPTGGFDFEAAQTPPGERPEPAGFGFEEVQAAAPAAPQRVVRPEEVAEEAIPGMPTIEMLEEPAAEPTVTPVTVAEPSLAEQSLAKAEEPAAQQAEISAPTPAAAALPDTPAAAPVVETKLPDPPPANLEVQGLPIQEVPLTELKLSKDVPQFKIGASDKGVVEPLGGKFERTGVAPIQVWRRTDGTLEVISGRHRFDLAQRSGEQTIPAQIHDEAQGFGKVQAAILDAELNIRDGQGKVKDYVNYFKESGIDREDADARGLLARATGKRSFTIANEGSDELVAAVRGDQIPDEAAYYIALNAPGDSRLQGVGIKAIQEGKSANTATNMMQAVKALAGEQDTTTDMFGFDDSAIKEAEAMAKIASQKQREIQTRLNAISGAA